MNFFTSEEIRWRDDGKCGHYFPLPDGSPAQCDPDGENFCCNAWFGECGNTPAHCFCNECTDFKFNKDWWESGGKQMWRYDGMCGNGYPLPNTMLAECDPDGERPCCNGRFNGICGNTTEDCTCEDCTDYRIVYKDWRESGGELKWRSGSYTHCGFGVPLPDGSPTECDPKGENPCCSNQWAGVCESNSRFRWCLKGVDFRVVKEIRESGENCKVAQLASGFLKNVCFYEPTFQIYFTCTHSDIFYAEMYWPHAGLGVDNLCQNDPHAYQVCGFDFDLQKQNSDVLCGGYICEEDARHVYVACKGDECKMENRTCQSTSNSENEGERLCDDKCSSDSWSCEDEQHCNGFQYGVRCDNKLSSSYNTTNLPIHLVCDGQAECKDRADEQNCAVTNNTVHTCTHYERKVRHSEIKTVPILNYTRCSLFDLEMEDANPYCFEYLDQTNCSDIERVGGYCKVNGFMSSVSKYVVCHDYDQIAKIPVKICDDNLQNNCLSPSDCHIHKHRMCDGVNDCSDGSDEVHDMCEVMSNELNFTSCTRTFQPKLGEHKIPVSWIMDNETDCMNGEDENAAKWTFCPGKIRKLELPGKGCQDVYKCPGEDNSYVEFDFLCDGVDSCGEGGENRVCRIARDLPAMNKTATLNGTIRSVCNESISTCEVREFRRPWGDVFGEEKIMLHVPKSKVNCSGLFGDYYLFLSCTDLCAETDIKCPLESNDRRLEYNSCLGQYPKRSYTLGNNSFLTFLDKSESGQYHQDYYKCDNGRCIEYKKVCDLVDNCGDMSDEINCTNHMVCHNTHGSTKRQFISWSQKCDGLYDCFDLSDECNEDCGKEILENFLLKITCWVMGVLAMSFNLFIVVNGFLSLKDCETEQMMISKVLMNLIGSGDFLIGLYLVVLSVYDSLIFGKEFCSHQAEWLTGTPCLMLGVISTLGSQISLFTMTVLSLIRVYGLTCKPMRIPGPVNKKAILRVTSIVMAIITAALAIAVTPLVPSLEDYFVQGIYYDPTYKVFIGFPNKDRHVNILQSYYEQNITGIATNISTKISRTMSWKDIGEKVDGMFTQDNGILTRSPVHFYGNDGMCLFKYFVRTNDARRSRQSANHIQFTGDPVVWNMLAVNLCCFITITCCYIVIILKTKQSSQRSGQHENEERRKNERAIQNKIMIIIATDFLCWVPFIIISGMHNLDYIDASHWYASFAMTVLPLNSVINPLVYEKALGETLNRTFERSKKLVRSGSRIAFARLTGVFQNSVRQDPGAIEINRVHHNKNNDTGGNRHSDDQLCQTSQTIIETRT